MNKLLFFSSSTCRTCDIMHPMVEEVRSHKIPIITINSAENPYAFEQYSVQTVPTIILADEDGEELERMGGFRTLHQIMNFYHEQKI